MRPAVLVQDDSFLAALPTVLIVPFTGSRSALRFPGTVLVQPDGQNGLTAPSVALVFQTRALDQRSCLQRLERARASRTRTASCDALAGLFLAMARVKQGRADEGRQLLAEAGRLVEALEKAPGGSSWLDLVHCRVALREAKATAPAPR